MKPTATFGSMDVNSKNQRWSRWVFGVVANPEKMPDVFEVVENGRRFFAKGFGRAGRVRCDQKGRYYSLVVEVEGPPAHDPAYREKVKEEFVAHFMQRGFGYASRLKTFEVGLLSGSKEDGTPPDQLLVMPTINLINDLLHPPET